MRKANTISGQKQLLSSFVGVCGKLCTDAFCYGLRPLVSVWLLSVWITCSPPVLAWVSSGYCGFSHHQNMHELVDSPLSTLDQRHWSCARVNPCPLLPQDGLNAEYQFHYVVFFLFIKSSPPAAQNSNSACVSRRRCCVSRFPTDVISSTPRHHHQNTEWENIFREKWWGFSEGALHFMGLFSFNFSLKCIWTCTSRLAVCYKSIMATASLIL